MENIRSLRAKLAHANRKIVDLEKIIAIAHKDVSTNLDDFIEAEDENIKLTDELNRANMKIQLYAEDSDKQTAKISELADECFALQQKQNNIDRTQNKQLLEQAAQLKSQQMMFRIMNSGYTHSHKRMFAEQCNKLIQDDIDSIIDIINNRINPNDLPF